MPSLGNRLVALVDYAASTHRRACALLGLLAVLCFSARLSSTCRRSTATRHASRRRPSRCWKPGDFVDIRFQGEARHKKPVGIYWLQAAVVGTADALGVPNARTPYLALPHPLADRGDRRGPPDLLGGARLRLPPRSAVLAAAMLASCVLLGVEARLAKTDAMLFLTVMAAQGALGARVTSARRPGAAAKPGWCRRRSGPGSASASC